MIKFHQRHDVEICQIYCISLSSLKSIESVEVVQNSLINFDPLTSTVVKPKKFEKMQI